MPEGASFYEGEDDKRCRVIVAGERCRGTRMREHGLCPGHAGVGGVSRDPAAMSALGAVERKRRATARMTLGISARRAASPVQAARVRAQERAEALAAAIVDGPLDDPEMGTGARQRAAISAVELLYPQAQASLSVDLPDDEDGVRELGWADMQALAARLLTD